MKVECIHEYGISLTDGKIYKGKELTDSKKYIAVLDNTNDWYCFPRDWFEQVEDDENDDHEKWRRLEKDQVIV